MQTRTRDIVVALVWLVTAPAMVYAQASISGVVKDTSGAVLPGVTVEAASPALIEKVRLAVTDGAGQYRIVDLRPGTYSVTFTLPGFASVRREGIELAGSFTATVDVELRVGALEETLTVTGETPIVDVQSAAQQQIVSRDVIAALPTGRSYQNLVTLNPSVILSGQDVGGSRGTQSDRYTARGTIYTDSRIMVDGLGVASADGGGAGGTYYVPNVSASQEVVATTSGGMGEAETAGVIVNIMSRGGGNMTSGTIFATGANSSMQGDNYTQALKDRGLQAPNRLEKVWDFAPSLGGPIVRDRLWYFLSARKAEANNFVAGMFYNKNAGNPDAWTYEPDLNRQAVYYANWWSTALRLTLQATPRNNFSIFWDEQSRCEGCPGPSPTSSPEKGTLGLGLPRVQQATWTSPVTNRVLFEAGIGTHYLFWGGVLPKDHIDEHLIPVTEQAGAIPGLQYRGIGPGRGNHVNKTFNWRSSLSYVTGTHNAKVGYRGSFYDLRKRTYFPNDGLSYRFNNGVPNQLTQNMEQTYHSLLQSHGIYAQDQWTIKRLTIEGAVRYDHWRSDSPDNQIGPNPYMPVAIKFPASAGARFHDISPRMSAAYDIFGDGKTALKVHLGKYMLGQESSDTGIFGSHMDPIRRLAVSTTRSWNDLNRNYAPDCNLLSPAANGECGPMSNQNFGTDTPVSSGGRGFSVNYDPAVIEGWGVRPYSWELGASVQRELVPRVSATVGYFRRWFGNQMFARNLAATAADYTRFNLPVPIDPRLSNSGGVVTGVATINPNKFGQISEQVTAVSNFGTRIDRSHGVEISFSARMADGLVMQGGLSTGSRLWDDCEIETKLPEVVGSNALEVNRPGQATPLGFCRQEQPFQTQAKFLGTYTIPSIDVQVSGTWQKIPGPEILANYNAPNPVVAPILGRNLAGGAANQTVLLIPPRSMYGEGLNQVDLRVAKLLKFGRKKTLIGLDLFNALNASAVLTQNNTYGPAWLTPTSILTARLMKASVQFDF